jgi:hypothetical protein
MKSFCLLIAAYLSVVSSFSIYAQSLYNGVGHIPTYYQERWNKAGLLRDMGSVEPKLVINFKNLSGDDDQKMTTALNDARDHVSSTGGLAIIYFQTGA